MPSLSRTKLRRRLHGLFAVLVLIYATSPLTLFLSRDGHISGNSTTQLFWVMLYGLTALLVLARFGRIVFTFRSDLFTLLLVALCVISTMWSDAPSLTLRRGIALIGTTLFAAYLATRFTMREQIQLIAIAMVVAAVLSLLVIIFLPELGIQQAGARAGTARGIYHQKASLGRFMSVGALALVVLIKDGDRRWRTWLGLLLTTALLVASGARAPIIVFCISLVGLYSLRIFWYRWHFTLNIPLVIAAVSIGSLLLALVLVYAEPLAGLIGRSTTMSGRIPLWRDVIVQIGQRPLVGHGYNAFWLGWDGPSAAIWRVHLWEPRYAHNGFLDLMLELGLIGLLLLIAQGTSFFLASVRYARAQKTYVSLWPALILLYTVLINLTDTTLIGQNSFMWIVYLAASLTVHRAMATRRPVEYPQERMAHSGSLGHASAL